MHAAPPGPYAFGDEMPLGARRRRGGGRSPLEDRDPWTGAELATFTPASEQDVDEAYLVAQEAQRGWAATTPGARAGVLRGAAAMLLARREEVVGWLVRECGATLADSTSEWVRARGAFAWAATVPHALAGRIVPSDVPGRDLHLARRPVGVVAAITPSTTPLQVTSRTLAPALAAGNAVIVKPSHHTPVCGGLLLARALEEAGLPAGLLSVLVGRSSEIGDVVVTHAVPRAVCFTGSAAAGEAVTRLAGVKDLGLELGGSCPLVVLGDADLEAAVAIALRGACQHQGQGGASTDRVIVEDALHDRFVERLAQRAGALALGDPSDPATRLGPLVSRGHLQDAQRLAAGALAAGGELVLGGKPSGPAGLALPPHVLTGGPRLPTAREEVPGPVVTVLRAAGAEEALELANAAGAVPSAAVVTGDLEAGIALAQRLEAAVAHVNEATVDDEAHGPRGADGWSGAAGWGATGHVDRLTSGHLVSVQRPPGARRR